MRDHEQGTRLAAQTVLANLFLDTCFDDGQIEAFAAQLRQTGLSLEQLDAILRDEVSPAFGGNLLSVAGEWALWDEAEVARILADRKTNGIVNQLTKAAAYRMVGADWQRLKAKLA